MVPESYTESVPVTTYSEVVEEQGWYKSDCVPLGSERSERWPAFMARRAGHARPRPRISISRYSFRGRSCDKSPKLATCRKRERGWCLCKR